MHKVKFYPVGNGDTSQIVLENGKRILFDYRHLKKTESGEGPEINLKETLKKELKDAGRQHFDVVAFTHGDRDHIENSTEFFELLHADKYKGNGRIKISELWVPAAMILETATNDQMSDEIVIWRQEARFRLKEGEGIRVFSKPDKLKDWLKENKIDLKDRLHLITDAGKLVPTFKIESDGVEFFCHSPFIKHVEGDEVLRNEAALIFNIRFKAGKNTFDFLACGDSKWDVLEDIVETTTAHGNGDRLKWDLYNIPHHCSYLALSNEKGEAVTLPEPLVEELLLHGKDVQAKNCYVDYLRRVDGMKFLITMEEPNTKVPEVIIFEIDDHGMKIGGLAPLAVTQNITRNPAPRAG